MNIEEIMEQAKSSALKSVAETSKSSQDYSKLSPELREGVDMYKPVIKYVNALVMEALRLYHENQSQSR
jgi:hypothetical protein